MPSTNPMFITRFSSEEYREQFHNMAAEKGLTLNEFLLAYAFRAYLAEKQGLIEPYKQGIYKFAPSRKPANRRNRSNLVE